MTVGCPSGACARPPRRGERFADLIPGCVGFELVEGAHHLLQEDAGAENGRRIARFVTGDDAHGS